MIPASFQKVTITRLRYPRITDHGVDRADYMGDPARSDITGCWAEPTETSEIVDGRLAVRTGWTVVGPPSVDLSPDDHVEFAGVEYDITGGVMPIPSVTGALSASKVTLVRWEG